MRGKVQLQGLAEVQKATSQTPPVVRPPGTDSNSLLPGGENKWTQKIKEEQ